jgi:hypothetical protein
MVQLKENKILKKNPYEEYQELCLLYVAPKSCEARINKVQTTQVHNFALLAGQTK